MEDLCLEIQRSIIIEVKAWAALPQKNLVLDFIPVLIFFLRILAQIISKVIIPYLFLISWMVLLKEVRIILFIINIYNQIRLHNLHHHKVHIYYQFIKLLDLISLKNHRAMLWEKHLQLSLEVENKVKKQLQYQIFEGKIVFECVKDTKKGFKNNNNNNKI